MSAWDWPAIAVACYKISVYLGRWTQRGPWRAAGYWACGACVEAQIPNRNDGLLHCEQCFASGCTRYLWSRSPASDGGRRLSIPYQGFDRSLRTGCEGKSACDALDRDPGLLNWTTIASLLLKSAASRKPDLNFRIVLGRTSPQSATHMRAEWDRLPRAIRLKRSLRAGSCPDFGEHQPLRSE